ncbi:MAG: hypothetical protein M0P71_01750 [Melioribacteraceae bacterium]|nr:hypothetical protein [Melioribacteraceae bacterium]
MSKNYIVGNAEDVELMNGLMSSNYPELIENGVNVGLFYVVKVDKDGEVQNEACLKKDGRTCSGKISLISDLNRMTDSFDAKIVLDLNIWQRLSLEEKNALLDHELYHLYIVKNPKTGEVVTISDESSKVKLKLKKHDVVMWGFHDIIVRHGFGSQELQVLNGISECYKDYLVKSV